VLSHRSVTHVRYYCGADLRDAVLTAKSVQHDTIASVRQSDPDAATDPHFAEAAIGIRKIAATLVALVGMQNSKDMRPR
jgi:hypothetical protein